MIPERPRHLIKYLSADAGLNVLQKQALHWSSPNLFSSPYEMNGKYRLPFNSVELLNGAVKLAASLIFNPDRPSGDSALMSAILRWRDDERFDSIAQAQTVLRDLLGKMVEQKDEQLHAMLQKWQAFNESVRVCCFSAENDLPLAWERYGQDHSGMAIALKPDDYNDLAQAQMVVYSNERVHLTTIKEQMGQLLYGTVSQVQQRFAKNLLQKPMHLNSEQEWRVLIPHNSSFRALENCPREEKMLSPGSIKAVYLGLNCSDDVQQKAMTLAQKITPAARVYRMQLAKNLFKFEPIELTIDNTAATANGGVVS